jgi:hypothetical protein
MAKLPRPYIPRSVRYQVAMRQLGVAALEYPRPRYQGTVFRDALEQLCKKLDCALKDLQLDHDPALENRKQIWRKGEFIDYDPPANHPAYLIYRERHAHHIKTNVRGDGAQYPDRVLANRERRRLRPDRPVRKIPSRPFSRKPVL